VSTTPEICVVVPTYQRRASVLRLLGAFSSQTLSAERFEIVVAIDGSTDGTREAIDALSTPFRLRTHWQSNRGRAAACNAGVRLSEAEVIVILDDDMVPVPGFLAAHLASHGSDRALGVLGAVPIAFDETSPPVVRYVGRSFNSHLDRLAAQGRATTVRDFYSGNFSIERRTLLSVGGFDDAFHEYGNEDVELAIRLRQAGVELLYSSAAAAWQHYEKTFAQLAHDHLAKGRTAVLCAAKHPELADQMRIGTFRDVPRKWFVVRAVLLAVTRVLPVSAELTIALLGLVERRHRTGLGRYYERAMDFCFWAGARAASRAEYPVDRGRRGAVTFDGSSNPSDDPPPARAA